MFTLERDFVGKAGVRWVGGWVPMDEGSMVCSRDI